MMKNRSLVSIAILYFLAGLSATSAQNYDLTNLVDQKKLGISFINNFNAAEPIAPIAADDISEKIAYQIADFYIAELVKQQGKIAGYKVGTFSPGQYDNGPVNGLTGPVTAAMFSNGIHGSGTHISVDCCNMSFVEADFAAVVGSDDINNAKTDMEILATLSGFRPFIEMPDILQLPGQGSEVGGVATNYDFRNAIIGDLIKTEATAAWIKRLNNFRFQMTNETGEVLADGSIKDAYVPLYRVRHLRDQLLKRGRPLKAGDLLSLGNMGAIRPLKENSYFDPAKRPVFKGNVATVSYIGLNPEGPATVSVVIDRQTD